MSTDDIIKLALTNLPTRRDNKSVLSTEASDHWKMTADGSFVEAIKNYKVIEQTEILSELPIDSRNPTVIELLEVSSKAIRNKSQNQPKSKSSLTTKRKDEPTLISQSDRNVRTRTRIQE